MKYYMLMIVDIIISVLVTLSLYALPIGGLLMIWIDFNLGFKVVLSSLIILISNVIIFED